MIIMMIIQQHKHHHNNHDKHNDDNDNNDDQWNSGYAKRKLKSHGDFYILSQCFVWITILLFNQLAEFWVAYFRVVYFPAG